LAKYSEYKLTASISLNLLTTAKKNLIAYTYTPYKVLLQLYKVVVTIGILLL